jgi:2-polyprenyl-3-methyl-5-hydroxy-6-metoxy-1,4-benzoquinol methylase
MSRDGEDMTTGFTAGEAEWRARLGTLRQIVRQELVARQLAAHLPSPPVWILDVGCGQGTQLLRARPPADVDALLACEERAGRTDPYRGVAALTHVIATPA